MVTEIVDDLDRWEENGEEIAIATLFRVRGSAPRPAGARLCLTKTGRMAGSVSGGCVENDVFERALQVMESGQPATAAYGISDEFGFEVGLSCGGSIDVLIEPFVPTPEWDALRTAVQTERPAAFAVAVGPGVLLGRKLTFLGPERIIGLIDVDLDRRVAAAARDLILEGGTRVLTLPWKDQEADIYLEAYPPPPRLYIVGATHVATALCWMASRFGFRVTVIDPRAMFATRERFPEAAAIVQKWPEKALDGVDLDAYSYVAVLAHDPRFDLPSLARALRSDARYIGAMGSKKTHAQRKERLYDMGFAEADVARIHAPIGLDLGGDTPEETALAIFAEICAVRHNRPGRD